MIPLTPLQTWLLLAALVTPVAIAVACYIRLRIDDAHAAEDEASLRQWRAMCDALDLYDWEDDPE
jgi:hypothetical protein